MLQTCLSLLAGVILGRFVVSASLGCFGLLAVPATVFVWINLWQAMRPERMTSTSGLDVAVGLGASSIAVVIGFALAKMTLPDERSGG